MSGNEQKKKHRTEDQHYVPQFYLRGFTNAAGRMVCYDKAANKSYPTTTKAAAQEPYFYEIPSNPDSKLNIPVNAVENALSRLEGAWARLLSELIRSADADSINPRLLLEFSPFLAVQWMRTKTYRDTAFETITRTGQSLVDDLVMANFPECAGKVKFVVDAKGMAAIQAAQLFDREQVERMANHLDRHIWTIGINNTEHPFYTSDHPVVRRGNRRDANSRVMVGVLDPGIEFAFPLDSKHILLIMERTHFSEWRKHDNRAVPLSAPQVRDYNDLQVMRSNQRVYCASDDFDLAREVCAAHPEIRDPNRPRVIVETTPIVPAGVGDDGEEQMKNYMFVTALE